MAGSPLTLTCSAEGNPEPSLSWSFRTADGRSVPRGLGRQLVFAAVSLSEAGRYDCEARNTEGNQTATVEVTVHGESEAPVSLTVFGESLVSGLFCTYKMSSKKYSHHAILSVNCRYQ